MALSSERAAQPVNIEVKARCEDLAAVRAVLRDELEARFIGEDHQVDTYFSVERGRLKLREGTIERHLIYYERPDQAGPKPSEVMLYQPEAPAALKELLGRALGVRVVVEKRREIYFLGNVKFHLDRVKGLGTFIEIEAIDREGTLGHERLREQCEHYWQRLGLSETARVAASYSDLLLES